MMRSRTGGVPAHLWPRARSEPNHLAATLGEDRWDGPPLGGCERLLLAAAYRRSEKGVHLTVDRTGPSNLSGIIDRGGSTQVPGRTCRDEGVEVQRNSALPDQSAHNPAGADRKPDHVTAIVNRVTAGSNRHEGAGKRAEVLHTCVFGPKKRVNRAVCSLCTPDHFTAVIDAARDVPGRSFSQMTEVDGRAVAVPKYGVGPTGTGGNGRIRAQTG